MAGQLQAVSQQIDGLLYQLGQEGLLNEQFQQLMQLQDDSNPSFIKEVVELYFQDSASKLERLAATIAESPPNYTEIDALVHQFKGSSASFGAHTIAQLCVQMREAVQQRNQAACRALLDQLRQGYALLQSKLEVFMQLEAQRKQLGG